MLDSDLSNSLNEPNSEKDMCVRAFDFDYVSTIV
jgi:hypothetical protein